MQACPNAIAFSDRTKVRKIDPRRNARNQIIRNTGGEQTISDYLATTYDRVGQVVDKIPRMALQGQVQMTRPYKPYPCPAGGDTPGPTVNATMSADDFNPLMSNNRNQGPNRSNVKFARKR